ncbi:MAG: EamA family transporter [bacterium]|nr:EamA family transporter [bacterium]
MSIVVVVLSQLLLREGAKGTRSPLAAVLAPRTLAGYALMGIVVLTMIYAMQKIPLRTATVWNSSVFILTPLAARVFLKDPLNGRMAGAALLIVAGIVVFSI